MVRWVRKVRLLITDLFQKQAHGNTGKIGKKGKIWFFLNYLITILHLGIKVRWVRKVRFSLLLKIDKFIKGTSSKVGKKGKIVCHYFFLKLTPGKRGKIGKKGKIPSL